MSISVVAGVWSSTLLVQGGWVMTATPGALGSITVQWSADNVNWTNTQGSPYSSVFVGALPPAAAYVRATAAVATATLDAGVAPAPNSAVPSASVIPTRGALARTSGPSLVAVMGDSIMANAVNSGFAANQICYNSNSPITWGLAFSMGALWAPMVVQIGTAGALVQYNRAVTGETTAQCLARLGEIDALPVKPRFVQILIGTNNCNTVAQLTESAADAVAPTIQLCNGLLDRNITPVLCTILPRGNGSSATPWNAAFTAGQITTMRGKLLEMNQRYKTFAGATPGVILVDWFNTILNMAATTSDPTVGYTAGDYIHPNCPGSCWLGQYWWNCMAPYVNLGLSTANGQGDVYAATTNNYGSMFDSSMNTNGGTTGTGSAVITAWAGTTVFATGLAVLTAGGGVYKAIVGGTSGSVAPSVTSGQQIDGTVTWQFIAAGGLSGIPANWNVNRLTGASSSTVATVATQPCADGSPGFEEYVNLIGVENAEFRSYNGASTITLANFIAGDGMVGEVDFIFDGAGANQYENPDIEVRWNSSATKGFAALNAANAQGAMQGVFKGRLRTPIMVVPPTGITADNFWVKSGIGNTGICNMTWRNVSFRKYNKSAVGAIYW